MGQFPAAAIAVLASGFSDENWLALVREEACIGEYHFTTVQILGLRRRKQQFYELLKRYFMPFVQKELAVPSIFKFFGLIYLFSAYFAILSFGLRLIAMQMATEIRLAFINFDWHAGIS